MSTFRELGLEDLIDIQRNCMRKSRSRCNECMLNDEYGDECIEIKDKNTLKFLEELLKIRKIRKFKHPENREVNNNGQEA